MIKSLFSGCSKWFCALVSGLFLISVFPPYGVHLLIWCALIPLFWAVESASLIRSFFLSYVCGIIFFTGLVYWLIFVTVPGTGVLILYLGLYFPLFICAIKWLKNKLNLNYIFTAPFLWCFVEYLRGTVMTGFPWDNLGYAFYNDIPLLQSVEFGGVSGLSFLAVLANAVLYRALRMLFAHIQSRQLSVKKIISALMPVVVIVVLVIALNRWGTGRFAYYNQIDKTGERLKIALIQANIPQYIKWDESAKDFIIEQYRRLTVASAASAPDLIIWPESSLPGFFQYDEKSTYLVFSLIKELKIPILFGGNRLKQLEDEYRYYNSAYFVEPGKEIVHTYDKIHLVPYGEYIPNKKFLQMIIPNLESVVPFEDFSFGEKSKIFSIRNFTFGVSICFEDIFPELMRRIPEQGADFIVNITNDAWYLYTSAPFQHFYMAAFRAVENRVSFVRSSNTGITGYVSASGTSTIFKGKTGMPIFEEGFMIVEVPKRLDTRQTFYTRHGEIILYTCSIISVVLLAVSFVYSVAKKFTRRNYHNA